MKKIFCLINLIFMVFLFGCGGSVSVYQKMYEFVGRVANKSAKIIIYGKEYNENSFPDYLYGQYNDNSLWATVGNAENSIDFEIGNIFNFSNDMIYFNEYYTNLIFEISGKEFVEGTISNIKVDYSTLKMLEIKNEVLGVSGNFGYTRNGFEFMISCDVEGKTINGKTEYYKNVSTYLYGSFFSFSKNLMYLQISTSPRGFFVDPHALHKSTYNEMEYYEKTYENGLVYKLDPSSKLECSLNSVFWDAGFDNLSSNICMERSMTTYDCLYYIPKSNGIHSVSVPDNMFVEISDSYGIIELNNSITIGDRNYYDYYLEEGKKYFVSIQSFNDILLSNPYYLEYRLEIYYGGINIIENYNKEIKLYTNTNIIDYLARFEVTSNIYLNFNDFVNIRVYNDDGDLILNGNNSKKYILNVIKGEIYLIQITKVNDDEYINFVFSKPVC